MAHQLLTYTLNSKGCDNMMINNKKDLVNALVKNHGRILLPNCMLLVNGLSIDDMVSAIYMGDTEFIRDDEDNYDMPSEYCPSEDDFLVELCDMNMMTMMSIPLSEIYEFEILYEYDENGYIKD